MKTFLNLFLFLFCTSIITGIIYLDNQSKQDIKELDSVGAQHVPQNFVNEANTSIFNLNIKH